MKSSHPLCATIALALLLTSALTSAPASAQVATAEDLFQRGTARMMARDFAAACPLFAESYRLDRAGGTMQNLAVCYEELGLWASAHARFVDLRAISSGEKPRQDRIKLAQEHIEKLGPRLSRIVVEVPPDSALPTLVVAIDDTQYAAITWTEGVVIDPGKHVVSATAPGKQVWKTVVEIGGQPVAQRVKVTVPRLVDAPRLDLATVRGEDEPTPTRTSGIIVGSAGLLVLGGGAFFGLLALEANQAGKDKCTRSQNDQANESEFDATGRCVVGSGALDDANDEKSRARVFANVANVLVPVGAVAVALGVYLFFKKPERSAGHALVMPTLGGAAVTGAF